MFIIKDKNGNNMHKRPFNDIQEALIFLKECAKDEIVSTRKGNDIVSYIDGYYIEEVSK
jgi:hypothetical protein